jgi:hypothetical protein
MINILQTEAQKHENPDIPNLKKNPKKLFNDTFIIVAIQIGLTQ